ncbi:MAG: ABC transporter ATP-binding protein [Alphaproteobacteria bacterium]|nr:ABC transporter ATP-binding protein [Alphaproteobacteria bacterium]
MVEVNIQSVWKYYGKTVAVKDLNLKCPENSFLAILGPSGCGKSSTLRMLAGLEHISAGDIFFGDLRVNQLPPKERDIAMVFENYALYPHKTVFENMANPLRLRNVNREEIDKRVRRAAELLQIEMLLDRKPMQLSGGQKQRTAIGRAIVREPKVFLFDEPIAHLDAKLRAHMRGELKHLQRRLETTMIYVTHDQLEAMSMADSIAVMHEGVLQQFGTPSDIYNHPANEWVAGFVGEPPMNFLDCRLERTNAGCAATHPSFRLTLTDRQRRILDEKGAEAEVRLGVRPDTIAYRPGPNSGLDIPAKVFVTEPLGGDMIVEVQLGADRITVKTKIGSSANLDEPCTIAFDASRIHLFAASNGIAYF